MALPDIRIRMSADDRGATQGVNRVTEALRRQEAVAMRASTGARNLGGQMAAAVPRTRSYGFAIQNAAFQVGDFAVQVGAGTAASRALAMQLPQLLGGFGVIGAVVGAATAIIVPFVGSLLRGKDATEAWAAELRGLPTSLDGIRGQVGELADLQNKYVMAIEAAGAASGPTANAVVSATKREYDSKLSLLRVSQQLLRIEMQERRIALRNLQSQAENSRNAALSNARNLGAPTRQATDAAGFAYTGPRTVEEALANTGFDREQAQQRRLAIRRIEADLELMQIAAEEASAAVDGVFSTGNEGAGGTGGGSGGGGRSRPVQMAKDLETIPPVMNQIETAAKQVQQAFGSTFADIITGAESARSAVAQLLNTLASSLLQSAGQQIFGAVAGAFRVSGFATGTSYAPGGLAVVGERGPELVNLPRGSRVFNNADSRRMVGGGVTATTNIYIDARGAQVGVAEQVRRELAREIPRIERLAVAGVQGARRRGYNV